MSEMSGRQRAGLAGVIVAVAVAATISVLAIDNTASHHSETCATPSPATATKPVAEVWQGIAIASELDIKAPDRPSWTAEADRLLCWRQAGCKWGFYSHRQPDCLAEQLDRDHLMPQAEYLRSGGLPTRYRDFYLDTANIFVLPSAENRAKSDDVWNDDWQPPEQAACQYATDWLAIKSKWQLSVDGTEAAKLRVLLRHCQSA